MSFAPLYLLNRLFFRLSDFFHHWYADGSRAILQRFVATFESLDRTFAFRVTLRYFWKPLYGDYTIIGRVLGFFFRLARLAIGAVLYSLLAIAMLAFYLVWLAVPFAILLAAYRGLINNVPAAGL